MGGNPTQEEIETFHAPRRLRGSARFRGSVDATNFTFTPLPSAGVQARASEDFADVLVTTGLTCNQRVASPSYGLR